MERLRVVKPDGSPIDDQLQRAWRSLCGEGHVQRRDLLRTTLNRCSGICWFEATELHSIAGCRQLERFDLDEALKRYRDEKLPRRKQSWSWAWATAGFGTAKRFGLGIGLGLGLVSESVSCLLIRIALQEQSLLVSQPLLEDILQGASGVQHLARRPVDLVDEVHHGCLAICGRRRLRRRRRRGGRLL